MGEATANGSHRRPELPLPRQFEATVSWFRDALVVDLAGELDMASAPRLDEQIEAAATIARCVAVNLSNVVFIDSAGVNALNGR
jgi:anti-anti-sigma factor